MWPEPPGMDAFRLSPLGVRERRVGSALRQAGRSLAGASTARRSPSGSSSRYTGELSTTAPIHELLAGYPEMRFCLIRCRTGRRSSSQSSLSSTAWTSSTRRVSTPGTVVDNPPDAELYRRVAGAFPGAWIEDPALTEETDAVLESHSTGSPGCAHPLGRVTSRVCCSRPGRSTSSLRFGSSSGLLAATYGSRCRIPGCTAAGSSSSAGRAAHPVPRLALPRGVVERRGTRWPEPDADSARARNEPARSAYGSGRFPAPRP